MQDLGRIRTLLTNILIQIKRDVSGTPNITIINLHKKYNSFCNELKTPKANDIVMQNQGNLSKQHEENNYKILISNDYDELHCEIDHYKTLSNHNE